MGVRDRSLAAEAGTLGIFLCWAVVFADVGTSVYYTPGILFQQVGTHAALFVDLTFLVFLLLAVKYSEVAIRYPEGGGVVTVATHAIHPVAGLLGGLFILVDYFLTAGISSTSGMIYLSVVASALKPLVLVASVAALVGLAMLNLAGVRASARVTAAFALLALLAQLAVVGAVLVRFGPGIIPATLPRMVAGPHLSTWAVLTGYAGAFLAFSGLESISQLAPAMREPRIRTSRLAMLAVAFSLALTTPLLTLWSTTMVPSGIDPNQDVSVLGGVAAGSWLQNGVAISAALLLVFACNTALIGCYHVLLALGRMRFLPVWLTAVNRVRQTPHWAILVASVIPVLIVVATQANTGLLGDLYAFGLLGAFSVTCASLDIVRWHERARKKWVGTPMFTLGGLTTLLVAAAWITNLFAKPMATAFGTTVVLVGLLVAFVSYRLRRRRGARALFPYLHRPGHPAVWMGRGRRLEPAAILVVLPQDPARAAGTAEQAIATAGDRPLAFAYRGRTHRRRPPRLLEILDPYADDDAAQAAFAAVETTAASAGIRARYIYVPAGAPADAESQLVGDLGSVRLVTQRPAE
ncbi:MAG TPA: APC family permease [Candidatus Dormibacteraeota bacterium]